MSAGRAVRELIAIPRFVASGLRRVPRALEFARNILLEPVWRPYTRLFLADDGVDWVLAQEMRSIGHVARGLGLRVASTSHARGVRRQAVLYANQFVLTDKRYFATDCRYAVAYFHGKAPGDANLAACYDGLRALHRRLERVQVSHTAMRELVLASGIDPAKVFQIPIGVETERFRPSTGVERARVRRHLELPADARVVGSFQKDGVGWGAGYEPKLIKGPDVLVDVLAEVRRAVPDLHVLLSGPARGYVRGRLEALGIPHRHVYPRAYGDVARLYSAIDAYLVTSREEGGPKAVLESMASGVPLITTRVGQAADLVRHGENGWMVEVGDVAGLAFWTLHALTAPRPDLAFVLTEARRTAEANSYDAQAPLWEALFSGFVEP